jgi:hypothetical protein
MTMPENFLTRWSRRKRGAAEDEPEPPAPALPEAAPLPTFDPTSLPAIETLTAASDIAAFLRAEVPAALRQAALRRAWALDPGIRDFIGPADYAWDYNAPDGVPGFALSLGGDLRALLDQAIGLVMPEPAAAEEPVLAPKPEPPAVLVAEALLPVNDPAASPPRRHGGAIPV